MQLLALQGDITRVITFQLARETSNRSYSEIGVSEPHHPLTHNDGDPAKLAAASYVEEFRRVFGAVVFRAREAVEMPPPGDAATAGSSA